MIPPQSSDPARAAFYVDASFCDADPDLVPRRRPAARLSGAVLWLTIAAIALLVGFGVLVWVLP